MNDAVTVATAANALNLEQLRFAIWLATPVAERQPETQRQVARMLRVHPSTLSHWKLDALITAEAMRLKRELVKMHVINGLDAQGSKAATGDLDALKFLMRFAGLESFDDLDGSAPMVGANASATIIQVQVNGADVDEDTARRVGARKLLQLFEVKPAE